MRPIKATGIMGSIQTRLFSSNSQKTDDEPKQTPKKTSKFFAFLQKAEDIDKQVQKVEDLEFELDESDIAFDHVPAKREGPTKNFKELSTMKEQSAAEP